MKDYYKILGLKETASMDEIRDRWVELMREFHPDQGKEGATEEEERVREINEAYQELKHSSTRVEYDLKRTYTPKKKNISFKKWGVPLSIVIALMAIGVVYFSRPRDSSISKSIIHSTEDSVLSPGSGATQETPSDEEGLPSSKSEAPIKPERMAPREESESPLGETSEGTRVQTDETIKTAPGHVPPSNPPGVTKTGQNQNGQAPRNEAGKKGVPAEMGKPVFSDIKKAVQNETSKGAPQEIVKVIAPEEPQPVSDKPGLMIITDQPSKNNGRPDTVEKKSTFYPPSALGALIKPEAQTNQYKPGPFIAEETEIRQFLVDYRDRYIQRDTANFLQMFSLNAVQNQKQKMDDIRRIYENFFNQSKDLQYLIEDVSIEIYQNAVEVKARYKVDQTLKKGGERKLWKGPIRWVLVKEDGALKILLLDYQLIK
ncbi:MAG: DnaJ domain-containing protein [Deltaproteobacteria bacterium]